MAAAPTLQHALAYAASGLHVFPLKPGSKEPGTSNGHLDATTDPTRLEAMFAARWDGKERGIGIATGPSDLLVVDLDGPEGVAHRHKFPATLTSVTGRGLHLYYDTIGTGPLRSTVRALGTGIDTRGAGGYVVAPPTRHPDGHRYRWESRGTGIQPAPGWVVEALARKPVAPSRPVRVTDPGTATLLLRAAVDRFRRAARPGTRNITLNSAVYYTRGVLPDHELAALWAAEAAAVGLPPHEAERTIRSALNPKGTG
jgi:hypothetical protein